MGVRAVGTALCALVLAGCSVLAGCGASVTQEQGLPAPSGSASVPATAPAPLPTGPALILTPRPTTTLPPRSAPPQSAPAQPAPTAPAPSRQPLGAWIVGASPLPVRADGYGQVLPTPPQLRVRRLPTVDLLPPPPGGRFTSSIDPISAAVRDRMGETWSPGCPVGLDDLRYLTVSFWGFDERAHTGELVVDADVAEDVVSVFRRLFAARFPIEEMRLVTTADLDAPATGDGNNTAALVCRAARGQTSPTAWSAHAYGLAIDLNPFQNPYHRGDLVLPELAGAYLDRGWRRPGMHQPDGVAVRAFAAIGWSWGGEFRSLADYMHFTATGR